MERTFEIRVDSNGINCRCQMKRVSKFDKMILLKAFMNSLEMDQDDVIEAMLINSLSEAIESGLRGKLFGDDGGDSDGDEDSDDDGEKITQTEIDIGAIEKLLGKKFEDDKD